MPFTFSKTQKLMRAARKGNIDELENIYRFDIPKKYHIEILFTAAARDHHKLVQHMMSKYHLSVNSQYRGSYLVNVASENNALETVELLLNHGVNINNQDSAGDNAAMSAKLYGATEVFDLLYAREDLDHTTQNTSGETIEDINFNALNTTDFNLSGAIAALTLTE